MEQDKKLTAEIWKYPTDRVTPFRTPEQWLQAKKKDDDIGPYWRVHDKLYDVSAFIKNHPGGSEWLAMTKGLDITEAFEAHHVIRKDGVRAKLATFYVKDATSKRNSFYTFEPNGFYETLRRRVEPLVKIIGSGPNVKICVMQDGLVGLFAVLAILGVWIQSVMLLIMSGVVLTLSTNGSHNFVHLKENWRKNYMDLSLLSSYDWRINHVLGHHLYPNTILDSEMSLAEPLFDFKSVKDKSWAQRYLPIIYAAPFYLGVQWLSYFTRWRNIISGTQKFRAQELIVIGELFLLYVVCGNFVEALTSWIIIMTSSSFYFGLFSFTVAHHHPLIWHTGDETRPEPDFGLCQMDAIRERSDKIYENLFFVMTRYGEHSLHHLFPSICHSKLAQLKPILLSTLEDFQEELSTMPEWELWIGAFKQLQKTEPMAFSKPRKMGNNYNTHK